MQSNSFLRLLAEDIIYAVKPQERNPGSDFVPGERLLSEGRSEREYYLGKVPLRPVQRIGFLVLGVVFVGFTVFIAVAMLPSVWREGILVKLIAAVLVLGWFLLFFPLGRRMIWSALTAPSERDDEETRPASSVAASSNLDNDQQPPPNHL